MGRRPVRSVSGVLLRMHDVQDGWGTGCLRSAVLEMFRQWTGLVRKFRQTNGTRTIGNCGGYCGVGGQEQRFIHRSEGFPLG
jgi:hypothetical protein